MASIAQSGEDFVGGKRLTYSRVERKTKGWNTNYTTRIKEEIDKLLNIGFIRPVKQATWLSPIVVVPKENGKSAYA